MEVVLVQEARCCRHFCHITAVVALAAVVSRLCVVTAAASPSPSAIAVVLRVTVTATLRVTVTVALHFTATVALRDIVVINLVAVVVGVVAADCTLCGVALWRLLCAVGGGSGGGLVHGDELEAAATGLCAARWRRRRRWGLEGSVTQPPPPPPPPLRCEPHVTTHAACGVPVVQVTRLLARRLPMARRWCDNDAATTVRPWHDRHDHGATTTRPRRNNSTSRPCDHDRDHDCNEAAGDEAAAEGMGVGTAGDDGNGDAAGLATRWDWRCGGIGDAAGLVTQRDWRRRCGDGDGRGSSPT
ncbi:hypothetical protein EDB86DRAFT_3154220 [Lactarius hatsudake]|nr:hypothetical protein EDB86DRAFT_3154220 [Lactarius hatsudake]